MHVELLTTVPVSGSVQERHYEPSARTNTWVRFQPKDGPAWVGVFGNAGAAHFSTAVPFGDALGPMVLVIAQGQGYIVDPRSGALIRKPPWFYSYSALAVPNRPFVLVATSTEIWITDRDRDTDARAAKRPPYAHDDTRVALDGLVFDHVGSEEATGWLWEIDGWYNFSMRYDDLLVRRGTRAAKDDWAFTARFGSGGFPLGDRYSLWMKQFWL